MEFLIAILSLFAGAAGGFFFARENARQKNLKAEAEGERKLRESERKIHENEKKAAEIISNSKDEARELLQSAKDEARNLNFEIEKRETKLESREKDLDKKVVEVEKQREEIDSQKTELESKISEVDAQTAKIVSELEKVAKLKKVEARELLFEKIEKESESDLVAKMRRADENIKNSLDEKARNSISQAIQKIAADVTFESTATNVEIPNDEMKGRIIGREGRNINAFERATGVDLIVDDTPSVVTISGFDLLRRFVAQKSLQRLIEDGRIHPARIEELVSKTAKEVDKMVREFGEKAVFETGVAGLSPEISKILGRLRFRTSYGQNVLQHSIEVAFLAEALAAEVGADAELAKKAGLLHDIGKAVSEEIGGKHAIIGAEICRKFKLPEKIINAVEAHHEDVEMKSPEAFLVAAADAISAARPGARRETVEAFIRRVKELENLVSGFDGVQKCFAIQAGREVRVVVDPEKISDLQVAKLAKEIARKIESDLTFPGEVKVLISRETRAEEVAR